MERKEEEEGMEEKIVKRWRSSGVHLGKERELRVERKERKPLIEEEQKEKGTRRGKVVVVVMSRELLQVELAPDIVDNIQLLLNILTIFVYINILYIYIIISNKYFNLYLNKRLFKYWL